MRPRSDTPHSDTPARKINPRLSHINLVFVSGRWGRRMPSIARFEPVIAVTCSLDGSAGRNTRGAQQARLVICRRDKLATASHLRRPGGSLVVHGQGDSVVSSSSAGEQSQATWTRRAFPTTPGQAARRRSSRPARRNTLAYLHSDSRPALWRKKIRRLKKNLAALSEPARAGAGRMP
jgi:hypothetical protein